MIYSSCFSHLALEGWLSLKLMEAPADLLQLFFHEFCCSGFLLEAGIPLWSLFHRHIPVFLGQETSEKDIQEWIGLEDIMLSNTSRM